MGFSAQMTLGQNISYSPEVLIGNRSAAYQHIQNIDLNQRWAYQNTFLLDNEYDSHKNRIYFFRNSISYELSSKWRSSLAFGLKNPGLFSTISWSYLNITHQRSFSYSIGLTFQKGISIEQSLLFRKNILLTKKFTFYYQIFAVANIDKCGYTRGLQQLRLGVHKGNIQFGIGLNFDQFNNGLKTLVNQGIYLKLKINKSFKNEK